MDQPQKFFKDHEVIFHSQEELENCCQLLTSMLEFDLEKRISICDAQKMPYLTDLKVPRMTTDQIRKVMSERLRSDMTLKSVNESFV
jgi:hypothetical protein